MKLRLILPIILLVILLVGGIGAMIFMRADKLPWTMLQTDSGLKAVYYVRDPSMNSFHAHLFLERGEADMRGREGIAHYIEHLVAHDAIAGDDELWQRHYNATTGLGSTSYFMTSEEPEKVMSFISGVFRPLTIDEEFMRSEGAIVRQEFERRAGENPYFLPLDDWRKMSLAGTELTRSVIGYRDSVEGFDLGTALSLQYEHYIPANATLVIYAGIPRRNVQSLINTHFEGLARQARPRALATQKFTGRPRQLRKTMRYPGLPTEHNVASFTLPGIDRDMATQRARLDHALNLLKSQKENMFSRRLIHEQRSFVSLDIDIEMLPARLGAKLEIIGIERDHGRVRFVADILREWLAEAGDYQAEIQSVMDAYVKREAERQLEYDLADHYTHVVEWVELGYGAPVSDEEYLEALGALDAVDLLEFLRRFVGEGREVSLLWKKERDG